MWGAPSQAIGCLDENALASFAEGRVADEARRAVEEHLADCAECRAVLARVAGAGHLPVLSSSSSAPWTDDDDTETLGPGTRVGRYAIQGLIGRGAMGTVYAAHDPDLDRRVAVKLLRAESLSDAARQRMRARLLREAKAMARLSHPEVMTVYDVGTFGDQLFVAMEHVDGRTLRQWRAAQHRSYAEIMTVYERAGSGLAAAHEAGLVHRDFKPDNVLIGRDGRVRVMDFGLARSEDHAEGGPVYGASDDNPDDKREMTTLTRTGALLGTPVYMAPEQLGGSAATARSDVFSFCVSLYEALYGERPFAGKTIVELQAATERGQVRPGPMMTRVPGWVRSTLLKGLQPSPESRFESMRALLDALRKGHTRARRRAATAGTTVATGLGILLVGAAVYTRSAPALAHHAMTPAPSAIASFSATQPSLPESVAPGHPAAGTLSPDNDVAGRAAPFAKTAIPETARSIAAIAESVRSTPGVAATTDLGGAHATALSEKPGTTEAAPAEVVRATSAAERRNVPAIISSANAKASDLSAPGKPMVGTNGALILE